MQEALLREVPWISRSSRQLANWLVRNGRSNDWTAESMRVPEIYRGTVDFITYENLFTNLWSEAWFQNGIRAFGLLALEHEGSVKFFLSGSGDLAIQSPEGPVFALGSFLNGDSLSTRHDPEFCDFCWDPVDAVGHILAAYYPSE